MIPLFPQFKKLELLDKKEVENFTKQFPPYSDFTFTSMWCWNTNGVTEISNLNNNLVILLNDYITGNPFYSFIGANKPTQTAIKIIQFSHIINSEKALKLIPEVVVENFDKKLLNAEIDPDNSDYIYLTDSLSNFKGRKLRAKRNFYNRFMKIYSGKSESKSLDITNDIIKKEILDLSEKWAKNKKLHPKEVKNEKIAIERFLSMSNNEFLFAEGVYYKDKLIAFSLNEQLHNNHAIIHFEKADEEFIGIYSYLMKKTNETFLKKNIKFLNFEQDLGLPGLRFSKKSFYPDHFLKKYKVSIK